LSSYYNGTDGCAVSGIVCADDVAVLLLNPEGRRCGYRCRLFGYLYGGGFTSNGRVQITARVPRRTEFRQYMERNDSQGYRSSSNSNNSIIGFNLNGGSSGGPWIVNFGSPDALTGESNGSGYSTNAVVGVTSWGSSSNSPKEAGASPFTTVSIQRLVSSECSAAPAACS
jgi:hypothetical protein